MGIFDHKKFVADHNRKQLREDLVDEGYTEEDAELLAKESIPEVDPDTGKSR